MAEEVKIVNDSMRYFRQYFVLKVYLDGTYLICFKKDKSTLRAVKED